jgi:hypothetical protein
MRQPERGDRSPNGAALALLNVMDRNPRGVMQALRGFGRQCNVVLQLDASISMVFMPPGQWNMA